MNLKFIYLVITLISLTQCDQKRSLQGWDDPNCSQWTDDGLICKKCDTRSYNDTTQKKCIKVNDFCNTWSQTTGKCITCFDGYGTDQRNGKAINGECPLWNGTSPQPPIEYDVNCKCFSDQKICLECYDTFYLDSTGKCIPAPSGCRKFQNNSCIQCLPGYYFNSQGDCNKLPENCAQADVNGVCTNCSTGYFLITNGSCISPPQNCYQVDSIGQCIECYNGYYLDDQGVCHFLPDNCNATDNQGVCIQCQVGYFLDEQNQCQILPNNCFFTDINGICTECIDGYYLDINKECQLLPQNCISANEQGSCIQCKNDFTLSNGDCVKSPPVGGGSINPDCAEQDKQGKCTKCRNFYDLLNGKCIPTGKNPNCQSGACQCGTGKCLQCKKGYFLDNHSICIPIGQNCKNYSQLNGKCTSCIKDYELVEEQCIPKKQQVTNLNCKQQTQNGTCTLCRKYYTLQNGDCTPAGKNPKCHYFNKDNICECCYYHDLYYLDNNNICERKNRNCDQFNLQNGKCTKCQKSYQLVEGQCVILG